MTMPFLSVKNIAKQFGQTAILKGVSFDMESKQTLAILGRSGCGKTTLLKIMAGLMSGEGEVWLNGENIHHLPPQARGIVYLYQEALLFPHLSVFENVAFGLRLRKTPLSEVQNQTEKMLVDLGLKDHGRKMPDELSGGQKQRVAFGRALIIQPRLLLLDEPFGALDVETRAQMQFFFQKVSREQGITSIFVTHDLKESLLIGHQWGYMENGHLDIFHSIKSFSDDPRTGVRTEVDFWKKL